MFTLMLPCAGSSSRYPNMRPKWSLTHPNGNIMLIQSLKGINLEKVSLIIVTVLKKQVKKINRNKGKK